MRAVLFACFLLIAPIAGGGAHARDASRGPIPHAERWELLRAVLHDDAGAERQLLAMLGSGDEAIVAIGANLMRLIGVAQPERFRALIGRSAPAAYGAIIAELERMPAESSRRAVLVVIVQQQRSALAAR